VRSRDRCATHQLLEEDHTMAATATPGSLPAIDQKGYAHPEMLVSTEWLAAHLNDPSIRIIESDEDVLLYDMGHIPNAQKVDWHADLNDAVVRDYVNREQFQELLRSKGIDENTTVVFYGDKNNWWATYAFWIFELFGFKNARVLDGGRTKWEQEGRPMTPDVPKFQRTNYTAVERDDSKIRAFKDQVLEHQKKAGQAGGRSVARRVLREENAHAGVSAGRRAARGTYPGSAERAVGQGSQPGRLVQVSR